MNASRRRCALSVPASDARKVAKAVALSVDEVVVDLEDSVIADQKDAAREIVAMLAPRPFGTLAVRVNAVGSTWFNDDLAACAANTAIDSIVVPKVEDADQIRAIETALVSLEEAVARDHRLSIQALIESPAGLANAREIAGASSRLATLIIGYADLSASLGRRLDASWQFARDMVLLAARLHGVQAIDGPQLSVDTDEPFRRSVENAGGQGFDGKWVIHPRQFEFVQESFTPDDSALDEARGILAALRAAADQGNGAAQWHGQMLDEAVAVQARRVLARGEGR